MENEKNRAGSGSSADGNAGSCSADGRDLMIEISGLKKRYRYGKIGAGSLQGAIKEWRSERRSAGGEKVRKEKNKSFYALDGIDLKVYKGETVGIIGRNGAGKSTLLKIISRITAPSEGAVDLYGRVTSMLEVGTGFHGDMTGRENIYLNGTILGMSKAEIDAKIDDIISFSELEDFIDTPIKRYSSGMFVKLGFAVAFQLRSEIVIMDEVLAVGDVAFQKKCIESLMKAAKDDGRTVLYVSHNMNTVRQLCDRCVVIDKGKIIYDGETDKAIEIYLGVRDSLPAEIVFGPKHRPDDHIIRKIKRFTVEKLRLADRVDPVFLNTEEAVVDLDCVAEVPLKNLGFRFEVWYQDGTKVASSLPGNLIDLDPGPVTVQVKFPLTHLVSGRYRVDIIAYLFEEACKEQKVDALYPGFSFQIEPVTDRSKYLAWEHKYWGLVQLHDLTLEKL